MTLREDIAALRVLTEGGGVAPRLDAWHAAVEAFMRAPSPEKKKSLASLAKPAGVTMKAFDSFLRAFLIYAKAYWAYADAAATYQEKEQAYAASPEAQAQGVTQANVGPAFSRNFPEEGAGLDELTTAAEAASRAFHAARVKVKLRGGTHRDWSDPSKNPDLSRDEKDYF